MAGAVLTLSLRLIRMQDASAKTDGWIRAVLDGLSSLRVLCLRGYVPENRTLSPASVHEAVKAAGEQETGITIHQVNEHYDEGLILFQAKCTVTSVDTADSIAQKVHQLEYAHYPRVIEEWIRSGR